MEKFKESLVVVTLSVILVAVITAAPSDSKPAKPSPECFSFTNIVLPHSQREVRGAKNHGACSCEKAVQEITDRNRVVQANGEVVYAVGGYTPACKDGAFETQQWAPWGAVWCVDGNGNQISDSVRPWMTPLNCTDPTSPQH